MIKIQIKKIQQIQSKCGFIRTGHGQFRQIIQYYVNVARRHISEINLAD